MARLTKNQHQQPTSAGPHLPDAPSYYKDIMSRFYGMDELTPWKPSSRNDWIRFKTELAALDQALGFSGGQCHVCAGGGRMQYSQDGYTLRYGPACKAHAHITPPNEVPLSVAKRRLYEAFHDASIDRATLATTGASWYVRQPLMHELDGGLDECRPGSLVLVALQGKKMSRSELRVVVTPRAAQAGVTPHLIAPPEQFFLPTDVGRVLLEGVARGQIQRYLNREDVFIKDAPWTRAR